MRMLDGIAEDTVDFNDNYSGDDARARRPPGPLPEPARQRQPGHRGRHGHEHPAPQPGRGHRRHRPPHRQPRGDPRRPDAVRAGPRLPHRRADHGPPGDHRRLPHRQGLDPPAGGVRDRGGERPRRRPDRRHRDAVPDVDLRHARPASPSWSQTRAIDGISDVNDESARGKTRLVIKLKKDAPGLVILNNLYKHTPLQTNFAVNTVALVDGVPRTLNLVQALQAYVDHQVDVIRRRSEYRLEKAQDRAHIVEGLLKAVDVIDAIIALIRASDDRAAARAGAHRGAVQLLRRPGRAHPRHAARPAHPAGQDRPRDRDGRAPRDDRAARVDPRRRGGAPHRHQERAGGGQGEVRRRAALQDHLRRRAT